MRSFRHWSPRYILNRTSLFLYQKYHPGDPWLTPLSNSILGSWLKSSDVGLEFGSGRSTIWLAKRIKHLTSVEDNSLWYERVQLIIKKNLLVNVDHYLVPNDVKDEEGSFSQYVRTIDRFAENSLSFVLVDGVYRDICAWEVISKIQPGGVLIIDDAQRYLPSDSHSPSSRTRTQGAAGKVWAQFQKLTSDWRTIWTSSGVTDTALFFKPVSKAEKNDYR